MSVPNYRKVKCDLCGEQKECFGSALNCCEDCLYEIPDDLPEEFYCKYCGQILHPKFDKNRICGTCVGEGKI